MPIIGPSLPIVTPDPPPRQRSTFETYGTFFYVAIAGLVVMLGLIGWFTQAAWSMRGVWSNVYLVNDAHRPDDERIRAAEALAADPRVTQAQRYDLALSRVPPDRARYALAETLTAEVVQGDPRGYVISVARSEGWPDWLRLLLARPISYAAGSGVDVPEGPLRELEKNGDPFVALWATYALAVMGKPDAVQALEKGNGAFADFLRQARQAHQPDRDAILDRATRWLRTGHPSASMVGKAGAGLR